MNIRVTQAAEGFARRAFSVDEIFRMIDAGILADDERFELIEGEIVPMSPKNHAHERIKSGFGIALSKALPNDLWIGFETTIRLSELTFVEPDLVVYPRRMNLENVRGADIMLAIEVSASSLDYDKGLKAGLYAAFGVQELWVVDVVNRRTFVHRDARPAGWRIVEEVGTGGELRPKAAELSQLRLRLSDME